jgi:glycosyltransferase involved in cell wall biosynthesis
MKAEIELSIVAPALNEGPGISGFVEAIFSELSSMSISFELIIVDDGSTDGTWGFIEEQIFLSKEGRLVGIRLDKNHGQMVALEVGLREARGEWVITMDSDLQHPPELIRTMWKERVGRDIVSTRQVRRSDSFMKKKLSLLFYSFAKFVTGLELTPSSGEFRLMKRSVVRELLETPERPKVFRFIIPRLGFRESVIDFAANDRRFGKSKYSLRKMFMLAFFSITRMSTRPLYLASLLSMLFIASSVVLVLLVTFSAARGDTAPGWASVMILISMSFGLTFGLIGIIGVYIAQLMELGRGKSSSNSYVRNYKIHTSENSALKSRKTRRI